MSGSSSEVWGGKFQTGMSVKSKNDRKNIMNAVQKQLLKIAFIIKKCQNTQ